jgi:hypothetical protein
MKNIGAYSGGMKKIGMTDFSGPKIGEMAKRAEENKKMVGASAGLEKSMMMKK